MQRMEQPQLTKRHVMKRHRSIAGRLQTAAGDLAWVVCLDDHGRELENVARLGVHFHLDPIGRVQHATHTAGA